MFRLSAPLLRAAGGQVRCGRCGEVFNALPRLAEEPTAFMQGDSPREMEARADVILEFPPALDLAREAPVEDDEDAGSVEIARLHFLDPLPDATDTSMEFTLPPGDLDRVFFAEVRPNVSRPSGDAADLAPHPESRSRLAPTPPASPSEPPEPVFEFTLPPGDLDRVFFADSRPNVLHQLIDDAELAPHPESQYSRTAASAPLPPQAPESVDDAEPRFAIAPVPPEFAWRELARRDTDRRDAAPTSAASAALAAAPLSADSQRAPPPPPTGQGAAHDAVQESAALRSPTPDVADDVRRAMRAAYTKPLPSLTAPAPPLAPFFRAWLSAALLLGGLLVVQVLLSNRDWLAAHLGGAGVTSLFSMVGVPVSPQANLAVYQLRQWGVSGDPGTPGTLRVRASILNTAAQLEPYPLLRITLANRFGAHVGARAFEPAEYLGKPASRQLAPGERLDATLDILDPGTAAEGFEIDVCLRNSRKRLYCAGDVATPR